MKIKNKDLVFLFNLVNDEELSGKQSRMRTKFIKMVQEKAEEFEEDRQDLLKQHCKLDKDGNPKTKKENDQEYYDVKDINKYNTEFLELENTPAIFEENETNEQILKTVREIVFNTSKTFKGQDAFVYDSICDEFEEIYKDK